jgi:predicted nucleic-acid-binding protein
MCGTELHVGVDDPRAEDVRALLAIHLGFSRGATPAEYSFALDVDQLLDPTITFFSGRAAGRLVGFAALKRLDEAHAELKSMHTATAYLQTESEPLLADLVAAETVYVLESFYEVPRDQIARAMRSLVGFDSVVCVEPALLLRAIEVYDTERIDFAEAYLVACAESTGIGRIVSFDRSLDRVPSVERLEPPKA